MTHPQPTARTLFKAAIRPCLRAQKITPGRRHDKAREKSPLGLHHFNPNKTCSLLSLAAHVSPFPNQETLQILDVPGHHPWRWNSSGDKVSRYPCIYIGHEEGKVRIRREKTRLTVINRGQRVLHKPASCGVPTDGAYYAPERKKKKGCLRSEARLLAEPVGADVPYSSRVS